MEVSLGLGQIVLYGDQADPQKRGRHNLSKKNFFGPCLLWQNGWIDQDATWYKGRPWPRPYCVR